MRNNGINTDYLPTSPDEVKERGWDRPDVILFSGDAYIDHPSFGPAVIGRVLEAEGLKVAIVPQPNWRDDLRDFKKLGIPRLFFAVSAGNMDSMVNHYTAMKRLRSDDAYTPGGRSGYRPDYPSIVYTQILKNLFPDIPVLLGGVEASMRRLAHYDYWKNSVEPSILETSGADMLIYGMGEKPVKEVVKLLNKGVPFDSLKTIPQTAIPLYDNSDLPKNKNWRTIILASYKDVASDKDKFSQAFVEFEKESNKIDAARLVQLQSEVRVLINPPYEPVSTGEADSIYDLPFTRLPHPRYSKKPPIPAFEMIKFSVNIHRGCFGGCSFCAIAAHQGKHVVSRSEESILREVETIISMPGFRGVISDIGGPSANMYMMKGKDIKACRNCSRPSCIWPSLCPNMIADHSKLVSLYSRIRKTEGLKRFFVTSGIRYDLLNDSFNKNAGKAENDYLRDIIRYHVSGRLKVAPEHSDASVLKAMRKTSFNLFIDLVGKFKILTGKYKLNYELVPYLISSHPGCTVEDMAEMAVAIKKLGIWPEQVQDFTPTPMTMATTMFYTGYDPYTGKKLFIAGSEKDKRRQNRIFFWNRKDNIKAVKNDLVALGRHDIVRELYGDGERRTAKGKGQRAKSKKRKRENGGRRPKQSNSSL